MGQGRANVLTFFMHIYYSVVFEILLRIKMKYFDIKDR